MRTTLLLDQPDLIAPSRTRRLAFGKSGPRIAILNARGARFSGGGDEPDLSIKWIPSGAARYRSEQRTFDLRGDTQMLLNRGQTYALDIREATESFVVFFDRALADAAWRAHTGSGEAFPEAPTVAGRSQAELRQSLLALRGAAQEAKPDRARLNELALALLGVVARVAHTRRRMAQSLPVIRRTTRDELLRRLARAESYLFDLGVRATLEGAANAAAMSPFHLIRLFRAVYGETPLAFATGKRLEAARDALILTGEAIEEVASRTGYESRTAFDRAFRRRFGDTPGVVRAARH
jgi:AraC family transcriptional regulator